MHIVTVCTGNVSRSPLAEYLLRAKLAARGIAAPTVTVSSCGCLRLEPRPMDRRMAAALSARGIDPSAYRSTPMTAAEIRDADVILCFEEQHIDRIVDTLPAAMRHTFLMEDFANVCHALAERGDCPKATPAASLATILEEGPLLRPLLPPAEEIADPYHQPEAVYAEAIRRIDAATSAIVGALVPVPSVPVPPTPASPAPAPAPTR